MNQEAKNLVKKTAKIAGITCIAAGAVALMATGVALKALTEGAKYLKNTVQEIIDEPAEAEPVVDGDVAEEEFAEESDQESDTDTARC